EQKFPIDNPTQSIKVNAREIWKEIIKQARDTAEPGLLFWDNILRESPADCYSEQGFNTVCTNPCQPGWAKVLTKEGIRTFNDIKIGDEIWSQEGWTKVLNKWSTGINNVYKYITNLNIFYGTENHQILDKGIKTALKEAKYI